MNQVLKVRLVVILSMTSCQTQHQDTRAARPQETVNKSNQSYLRDSSGPIIPTSVYLIAPKGNRALNLTEEEEGEEEEKGGMSTEAKVGIALGATAAVAVIGIGLYFGAKSVKRPMTEDLMDDLKGAYKGKSFKVLDTPAFRKHLNNFADTTQSKSARLGAFDNLVDEGYRNIIKSPENFVEDLKNLDNLWDKEKLGEIKKYESLQKGLEDFFNDVTVQKELNEKAAVFLFENMANLQKLGFDQAALQKLMRASVTLGLTSDNAQELVLFNNKKQYRAMLSTSKVDNAVFYRMYLEAI